MSTRYRFDDEADEDLDPPAQTEISFEEPRDRPGVRIHDPIDRHQFDLYTPTAVSPTPTATDQFLAPVDVATEITTSTISYPNVVAIYVRDEDGNQVVTAEESTHLELEPDTYIIELEPPIKLYLRVECGLTVEAESEPTVISFDEETDVKIGARSHHEHPAATVTTTEDPVDMMKAISTVGSALKTTSPERSYPTLRGHPPLIELGESLEIPPGLEPPDTGVHIELPPDIDMLYEAAPLAYYLGADLREAESPAIVTDDGYFYPLDTGRGFSTEVERALKQVFFLDCITRTEGFYKVDLHERYEVEGRIDLDFESLYGKPLSEQLESYLEVPFEKIESHIPEWKLTTHIPPDPDGVESLPFALNELAVVRAQSQKELATPADQAEAIRGFVREGEMTRSASAESTQQIDTVVQPDATDTLGQAWIGEGAPVGATKASLDAFRNRLEREPTEGDISIAIIRNDPQMEAEREGVESVYGSRENLPFDVSFHNELTKAELRDILEENLDFLHYIGHVDDEGFECADGKLDVRNIGDVGVDSFFLNACQSYAQGMALIDRGAIGGVVTLREVVNSGAVEVGKTLARLLNQGFPLRPALELAKTKSVIGEQYIVVGDGELAIAQSESGTPIYAELEELEEGFELTLKTYPTTQRGMGSLIRPRLGEEQIHFLNSGTLESFRLNRTELEYFLFLENAPILMDDEIHWREDVPLPEVEPG